jgi:phosphohistidine swiveling domain-containing protein
VFGTGSRGDQRLDLEFARDAAGYVLLQVRPALFPVQRNPTLSLANHKEIMGDPPSPWLVSALVEAGQDLSFPARADPVIGTWGEAYAVELAGRAWLNVSFWYRWMDHFGLPRTVVTEGVGGHAERPADARPIPLRLLRSIPRLLWFQWCCLRVLPGLRRAFRRLDLVIDSAGSLADLHRATVEGLRLALYGNFAINPLYSAVNRVRRALHLPGAGRSVTQDMMEEYSRLSSLPVEDRAAGLDRWLVRYGHRGPLESDLARPRFAELRDVLLGDLSRAASTASSAPTHHDDLWTRLFRPLYRIDERREWFRDSLMRRWQRLRARILEESRRLVDAGALDDTRDAFWLRGSDLDGSVPLRKAVALGRSRIEAFRDLELPLSASLEHLQGLLTREATAQASASGRRVFTGIALGSAVVEGRAYRADDLLTVLGEANGESGLGPDTILVVPTLEPSWAVVFPRVGGVVAEVGGELSHASILLREERRPAVVNCAGIFRAVRSGDRLRLDGSRGLVELLGS